MSFVSTDINTKNGELAALLGDYDAIGRKLPNAQASLDAATAALADVKAQFDAQRKKVHDKIAEINAMYVDILKEVDNPSAPIPVQPEATATEPSGSAVDNILAQQV